MLGQHWLAAWCAGTGRRCSSSWSEIPPEVLRADAELALAAAGLELEGGDLRTADELLVWAYDGAGRLPAERRRRFAVASTAASLYRARLSGDVTEALSAAREVLGERWDRRLAPDVRALTLANLGIAEFWAGSLAEAGEHLQQAAGLALECGNDFVLFMAECYAAATDAREARLAEAARRARTAIQLAERRGWTGHAHAAIAYATLGTVMLWRDDLAEAERYAARAVETLERSAEPLLGAAVAQLRARLLILRGEPLDALDVLRAATAGRRAAALPQRVHGPAGGGPPADAGRAGPRPRVPGEAPRGGNSRRPDRPRARRARERRPRRRPGGRWTTS